jgi:hypothetical protein
MASNSATRFVEQVQNFLAFAGAEPPPYVTTKKIVYSSQSIETDKLPIMSDNLQP